MLATFFQFNFCYLLKFTIISSIHGAFSLYINVHVQNFGTKNLSKKILRKVWYWNREKVKKASLLAKKVSYKKTCVQAQIRWNFRIMQGISFIKTWNFRVFQL